MRSIHAVVTGAGPAGLSAALMLARAGHRVSLMERDPFEPLDNWEAAFNWSRTGIPHFHQPHGFLPRGRKLMRELLPDIYAALLDLGAAELDIGRKNPGQPDPADADLVGLGARRELIEWVLRRAAVAEPYIRVHSGAPVTGLLADAAPVPVVRGVRTASGEEVAGDLVVDALGRNSPMARWLESFGAHVQVESSDTAALYYSRYYKLQPGLEFPDGPWLISPAGSLGYAAFVTFIGDNNTFAVVLSIPVWDQELRVLQHVPAFEAACAAIPLVRPLVDPQFAQPITDVRPMGSLRNMLRTYVRPHAPTHSRKGLSVGPNDNSGAASGMPAADVASSVQPVAEGIVSVGDALCHTSPQFALGLSMSLAHAHSLVESLQVHAGDVRAAAAGYYAAILPEARERYALARDTDADRNRLWRGEKLDVTHRSGSRPLFMLIATGATALHDPDIFHKTARRIGFLDRTSDLDDDAELLERVERLFGEMLAAGPPPAAGPTRQALLELLT